MSEPRDATPTEPPAELRVVETWESDRLVLLLHGELGIDTLPTAQLEVSSAQDHAPPVLVLDLSLLDYVDSSGVRLVLLAQQVADDANRRFAVRLGHGPTRRIFDTLGVTGRLEVLDGEASSP